MERFELLLLKRFVIFVILGDALLERLEIKENAFVSIKFVFLLLANLLVLFYQSQVNLPIRVKGGFLSEFEWNDVSFIDCMTCRSAKAKTSLEINIYRTYCCRGGRALSHCSPTIR